MTTPKLHIGTRSTGGDFRLPLDLVTQTCAILAKKGAGKSYTGMVAAEELLAAGQPIIVLDPTGAWFGLKSSADGKAAGYPVVVFGGDHADVPLEPGAGEVLARAIVERRFSAILDLSLLRKGESVRFVTAFLETLYRMNREPVHLFVDEADDIAPQKPYGQDALALGAIEDVVKRGRKKGIGCTLITQRPADLAKQVLTQCELLVAMRIVHHLDIKAIHEWVRVHADPATAKTMIESLPSLPIGTAWFWSPGWGDIFERVAVRRRHTFDSSATPKAGQKAIAPKVLAGVDIAALGAEIQATVEKIAAEDPKALKAKIRELEQQLRTPAAKAAPVIDQAAIERVVRETREKSMRHIAPLLRTALNIKKEQESLEAALQSLAALMEAPPSTPRIAQTSTPRAAATPPPAVKNAPDSITNSTTAELDKPSRRILDALAWWKTVAVDQPTTAQVGAVAGYAPNGGSFSTYLSRLSSRGLIERIAGCVRLLPEGDHLAIWPSTPPTLADLHERIRSILDGPGLKIIDAVIAHHGAPVRTEDVARIAGYEPTGGSFSTYLSRLSSLGLIDRARGVITPTRVLFPEGLA